MAEGVALQATPAVRGDGSEAGSPATRGERLALTLLMLLPGALIVFTGFTAGGYFPSTPAIAALVLTQILIVRLLQARHPVEGFGALTLVAVVALALYGALTLASALWSHSTGRALIAFDRVWLYLLVLVLFGTVRASTSDLRWLVRGLLLGASIVCLAGLISRVAPDVWHTAPTVANERLSYPVTYWNALGVLAALGIVLAFHLTCTLAERRLVRALAAAVLPLLAATLFFTFSRGAIAAGAIGLAVYALIARPRGLLSGVLATAAPSAALVVVAYKANLLDTVDSTTPAAVSQGHRVALAAVVCSALAGGLRLLLAARLDPRLRSYAGRAGIGPRARAAVIAGGLTVAAVAILALGVPQGLAHDWNRFLSGVTPRGSHGDLRQRLVDPSNNGRGDLWRAALHGFSAAPGHGRGAGMYQVIWEQRRPRFAFAINAHSLYLETMAELGLPGLILLLTVVGAILGALAARAGGSRRSLYGALLAAAVVWALHAGVDWDWQMPVTTLGFFAVAGLALGPRDGSGPGWIPGPGSRLALGLLLLATAGLPVLIIGSQRRLGEAERALYASNCSKAGSAALSSIGWLDVRAEPYEIVGFCDLQRGMPRMAVSAMREAARVDPGSWEPRYALALAQAAAGMDPRSSAALALRRNPFEPLTIRAARALRTPNPSEWVSRAASLRAAALASSDLSIAPS
ncbi:MAG TPA: O-antigen ligase family protein [Solirubrobacteraceae bacterium]|nr:O-antigen ligase family protein [Solirubrobacteraceae bacterium]